MKQLGLALYNARQLEQRVKSAGGDDEFNRQRDQAQRRLSELQQSIQADQAKAQEAAQVQSPSYANENRRTWQANPNEAFQSLGNGLEGNNSQLGLTLSNSTALIQSNAGDGVNLQIESATKGSGLNFELQTRDDSPKDVAEVDSKSGRRSGKIANQETRQSLRDNNEMNLDVLNGAVNQQKLNVQQFQQGGASPYGVSSGGAGGFGGGLYGPQPGVPVVTGGSNMGLAISGSPQPRTSASGLGGQSPALGFAVPQRGMSPGQAPSNPGEFSAFTATTAPQNPRNAVPGAGPMAPAESNFSGFDAEFNGRGVTDGTANGNGLFEALAQNMPNAAGIAVPGGAVQGGGGDAGLKGLAGWSQTGGLSLDFELPTTGRKLVFSKVGGDPKLALAVRPQESIRWGLNLAWSVVWMAIGVGVILAVRSPSITKRLTRELPVAAAVLGGLGFFILPGALGGLAFVMFVVASVIVAWIHRHPAVAS